MHEAVTYTKVFETSNKKDMEEYSALIGNPLCFIIEKSVEKISDKIMGDEGQPLEINERVQFIVTWKEKKLL